MQCRQLRTDVVDSIGNLGRYIYIYIDVCICERRRRTQRVKKEMCRKREARVARQAQERKKKMVEEMNIIDNNKNM